MTDSLIAAVVCLPVGVVLGFLLGKRASTWCVRCGRTITDSMRYESAGGTDRPTNRGRRNERHF